MAASSMEDLLRHEKHRMEIGVYYGRSGLLIVPVNAAIECMDCSEVLLDFDARTDPTNDEGV